MTKIYYGEHKARKGLFKVKLYVKDDFIERIQITGDFILHPEEVLWEIEKSLQGCKIEPDAIKKSVQNVIKKYNANLIGASINDLVKAIFNALEEREEK